MFLPVSRLSDPTPPSELSVKLFKRCPGSSWSTSNATRRQPSTNRGDLPACRRPRRPLAKRLQLGAVLGYLLAGVVIGPQALGLIRTESVAHISELGVVCCCSSSAWSCRPNACG
jgi:hypothetical protein